VRITCHFCQQGNYTEASDLYRIVNLHTLVTANLDDLYQIIQLNSQHQEAAPRKLYNTLNQKRLVFNLEPGVIVKATAYWHIENVAAISWDNHMGYVSQDDLPASAYLGAQEGTQQASPTEAIFRHSNKANFSANRCNNFFNKQLDCYRCSQVSGSPRCASRYWSPR
jgi:hypothetical protein